MNSKILITMFICSLLIECNICNNNDDDVQEFLFEIQYTNWAWGFGHSGTCIDAEGNAYSYQFDNTEQFNQYEKDIYTRTELQEKYNVNRENIRKINKTIIDEKKKRLISSILQNQYSDTLHGGCDMGQKSYGCYILEDDLYRKIILRSEGDMTYQIESSSADSLIVWLNSLSF